VLHNLHLGLAGSERASQLERFLSCHPFRGIHEHTPVVVGGDFNDVWGTLGPRFLAPVGFRRAGPLASTFPAAFPVRPLDGIFVRGDLEPERPARPVRVGLARVASDHLPLVVDLALLIDRKSR
jgi:endonuclease/exonuclease/phosphatase family metal-dependent hydrolase